MPNPARKSPHLRWRWLLPVAALLLAFHFLPFGGPTLDRAFFDAASRHPLRPPPLPADSALVLVDEVTLKAMHDQGVIWPFPRKVFAALIAGLHRAGAARIVFDFTFFEESPAIEQDYMLASTAAAVPGVVLGRTSSQAPVFWSEDFVRDHPGFFKAPRTGNTELNPDEDGVTRAYLARGSLAAGGFDPPAQAAGGLIRWQGGLEQLRS
ncbi:MAG TPA: CHASE2 domain-containing protein, partial [Candidatus Didemnitutus sp.]|nr:CHASE2 domain-containing protein [Candidatus Didemnitutus sp.]